MREKELRMYKIQKQCNIQFTRRPRETEIEKAGYYSESESERQDYYNYTYDESDGNSVRKTHKKETDVTYLRKKARKRQKKKKAKVRVIIKKLKKQTNKK